MDETNPRNMDGETWAALRRGTGLTQQEVEKRLGWKRGHLSLIEHGYRPTTERADKLLRFYAEALLPKEA